MLHGLLLLGALVLRLCGNTQGYPDYYGHVDEIGVAASIWNFFRAATLEPTEFTYPGFYSYLVAASVWLTGALGLAALPTGGSLVERLVYLSYADPAWSALVGRTLSAVAGTATVAVVYGVGRRVGGRPVGLAAAAMMAVASAPVHYAHHALPDSVAGLLGALVMARALAVGERGGWRDYLAAGSVCGLLLATKYNGALCALAVVAAHATRRLPASGGGLGMVRGLLGGWRLWAAGLAAVVAAVAASPYLLLSWERYLGLARYQVSSLDFSLGDTSPWWWIVSSLVTGELVVGGVMLSGLVVAAWRRDAFDWLVLAACVPAGAYIGSWTRESLHYLLPYYPFLVVAGGRSVVALGQRAGATGWRLGCLGALVVLPSLWAAVGHVRDLQRPDTRSLAADWIEAHVPPGSTLGMTWFPYCPRLQTTTSRTAILDWMSTRPAWQASLRQRWAQRPSYEVVNLEVWLKQPVVPESMRGVVDLTDPETRRVFSRGFRSLSRLRADGVTHVVLPEAVYQRYMRDGDPPANAVARFRFLLNRTYFRTLLDSGEPLMTIAADRGRGGASPSSACASARPRAPA